MKTRSQLWKILKGDFIQSRRIYTSDIAIVLLPNWQFKRGEDRVISLASQWHCCCQNVTLKWFWQSQDQFSLLCSILFTARSHLIFYSSAGQFLFSCSLMLLKHIYRNLNQCHLIFVFNNCIVKMSCWQIQLSIREIHRTESEKYMFQTQMFDNQRNTFSWLMHFRKVI